MRFLWLWSVWCSWICPAVFSLTHQECFCLSCKEWVLGGRHPRGWASQSWGVVVTMRWTAVCPCRLPHFVAHSSLCRRTRTGARVGRGPVFWLWQRPVYLASWFRHFLAAGPETGGLSTVSFEKWSNSTNLEGLRWLLQSMHAKCLAQGPACSVSCHH